MKLVFLLSSLNKKQLSKLLLTMKFTVILLTLCCMQAGAEGYAQNITLSVKNAPLAKVLQEIKKQSGYAFWYENKHIAESKNISVNIVNESLNEALYQCFKDLPLTYSIVNKTVVIKYKDLLPEAPLEQQREITVTGKVVDASDNPLESVTITVKETKTLTMTDANGNFSIKCPHGNAFLIFTSIGYKTMDVAIGNRTSINIKLEQETQSLEDVVVVGYGTQKKLNLTGAVSEVKGSDLSNRPVVNATQSLQGLVPGLNVNVGTNTRPGQSFNLNIRGLGNLSNSDNPYVLVDGFEMSLADINPNDIESISVLKDASTSAIYGARAAYGVILVTTKKGSADKMSVSYSGNVGFTSPIKLPAMVNSFEFAKYFNEATYNALGIRQYSEDKLALLEQYVRDPTGISSYPEINQNSLYPGFENNANGVANSNWFQFHYKPYSKRQSHSISMSGGNKLTQFYVSAGYYNEEGILRFADINYDRYNLNANISSQLTPWLKIKANTKYTRSQYITPFTDGSFEQNFFNGLSRMRPNFSPYGLNGDYSEASLVPYLQSGTKANEDNSTLALIAGLEIEPVRKLKIFADLNIRQLNGELSAIKVPGTIYGIDGTPITVNRTEFFIPLKGSYSRTSDNSFYISPNIYSTFSHSINNSHNFVLTVGYQQESNAFKSLTAGSTDLISPTRPGINLVTGEKTVTETRNHWATQGGFGRLTYNFKQKYLLEFNGRYDGSSRFAPDSRWGFFPSVSAGYNIAQEGFIRSSFPWINQLKIRGSYGYLGNQSGASLYSYLENMNIVIPRTGGFGARWYYGNARESYITVPGSFNPNITWEKVESSNLGLDFLFLRSRLSGSFDVYQRNTRDMMGPTLDIADMYGATPPNSNNADLRTRGWELTVNWKGKINNRINYSVGGLVSDYKSVVTKYENPTRFDPPNAWYQGKNAGEIWGYRSLGLIQTEKEAEEYNKLNRSFLSSLNWKPGDVKFTDLNNDGRINNGSRVLGDMGDMTIIGNSTPRYAYSFNGNVTWKNLGLYVLWQGIGKRDFAPQPLDSYFWGSASFAQVTVFEQHLDYWTPERPNAYYPNPYSSAVGPIRSYVNKTQTVSDRYLQNAAYLRLKNVTVNYLLPSSLINKVRLSKVNVFVTGENLFTATKLTEMFDPETLASLANGTGKMYPLSKVFSFGLNITF